MARVRPVPSTTRTSSRRSSSRAPSWPFSSQSSTIWAVAGSSTRAPSKASNSTTCAKRRPICRMPTGTSSRSSGAPCWTSRRSRTVRTTTATGRARFLGGPATARSR
uniref:(northern house mosquito) hypothetical protein n=1 Tax=Culex pipiens TaxID=7175 RepID=A0A8D8F052_CULPI